MSDNVTMIYIYSLNLQLAGSSMLSMVDVDSQWQRGISTDGMRALSTAAVPEEVQRDLLPRMRLEAGSLLEALATPPKSVCIRCTDLTCLDGLQEALSPSFKLEEAPKPLYCPEARIIVARSDSTSDLTLTQELGDQALADFIIDAACAVAVLRGADVFCMGVMAASPKPLEGQLVRLWVVPEGVRPPNRGSVLVEAPAAWPAILVAGGRIQLPRAAIFQSRGPRGMAVKVLWRRSQSAALPAMDLILQRFHGKMILQQLPSCMCTRVLGVMPGQKVLDMCAAPGGKTTHLAAMLGNAGHGLTAIDRSLAKVRRIEALCREHGLENVRCVAADSRHLLEAPPELRAKNDLDDWPEEAEVAFKAALLEHGADRFRSSKRIWKAVLAALGRGPVTRMQVNARLRAEGLGEEGSLPSSFQEASFHRILLDPPCSAMGQRPLLRWGNTLADIQHHADYQRQFLCTASKLLSPGGELVYSTCTLTPQENEENVAWALNKLPLKLLDARETAQDPTECAWTSLAGLSDCGLNQEQRLKVLRFDPREWDAGFFIARFVKVCDVQTPAPCS